MSAFELVAMTSVPFLFFIYFVALLITLASWLSFNVRLNYRRRMLQQNNTDGAKNLQGATKRKSDHY